MPAPEDRRRQRLDSIARSVTSPLAADVALSFAATQTVDTAALHQMADVLDFARDEELVRAAADRLDHLERQAELDRAVLGAAEAHYSELADSEADMSDYHPVDHALWAAVRARREAQR